jgi:hypothetical protein
MKKVVLALAVIFATIAATAQEKNQPGNNDMKTIFDKNGKTTLGWTLGIESGYTQFSDKDVWMGGLTGGMVINHNFTIGLTGKGFTNHNGLYYDDIDTVNKVMTGAYLEGCYGGLLLQYTLFPKSVIHVTFPLLIGGGNATYTTKEEYYEWNDDEYDCNHKVLDTDAFFVIEPGIRAEVNILKFMRLNAGISYRYIPDLNLKNTSPKMMNTFNATFGLTFGKF